MISATFQLTDPDACEATMRITATLRDWKRIRKAFEAEKEWAVVEIINRLVRDAEEHFYSGPTDVE